MLKAKKIAQDELNASLAEQASVLETDTLELRKLETAVANGATYEEAFASSIKNASTAAKEHAIQTKGASGSTDVFVSKQRSAQASLRATATASKTASVAMRALSMAMNMIVIGLITKGLELLGSAISNYIHRVEKANEKIEESRSSYEDAKSSIESMNDELKTTQYKIDDLQSKGTLSFTDKAELDNLKAQNDELERSISLEEKKKQNAASQTVNDIKQNKDTLFDDFEESIKNLSEYQEEYEHMRQVGVKGISDGTVTSENYEVTMTAMDKNMDLYEKHVLENIEKFEKYKEDILNKYSTDDVSQFSQSDRDLYNSIVSQLQEAYKTIYSDSEYNKFVIEPIFDQDKLKGLQDQLLQYFVSGGSTDTSALEEKFGSDIITALRNACEKAGIDFDKMIEDMYSNSQSKLDQIAPIIEAPNGAEDAKQNQISKKIRDYIQNDLSEEDRTILLTADVSEVDFSTLDKYIEQEKSKSESAIQDTKSQLEDLSKNGNVDLTIRPVIDSSAMQAAGWDVEDGSIATTFTQGEFIWQGDEENGQYVYVHYTPILPDGTVLTPDQVSDYLYGTLEGSQNILDADDKGLVLKVDTDLQGISEDDIKALQEDGKQSAKMSNFLNQMGQWDDSLHDVQEGYYLTGDSIDYVDNAVNILVEDAKKAKGEIPNETPISPTSFEDAWTALDSTDEDAIKTLKKDLLEAAEAGQLSAEKFNELDKTEYFKNLGISADSAIEKINGLVNASTQLSSMSAQISKMSDMLADKKNGTVASASDLAGFDVSVRGLESWAEFERVMGDSTSTMDQCQKAANALATEWVNDSNFLSNLTDENKAYYETQLDQMGVANAQEVITDALARKHEEEAIEEEYAAAASQYNAQCKDGLNAVSANLAEVTAGEITRLQQEGIISADTAEKISVLAVKKAIANGTTLDTSGDIRNLANLAGAATQLGRLLESLAKIKQGFTNGMPSDVAAKQAESYQKQIEAYLTGGSNKNIGANINLNVNPKGSRKYKPSGGSGGSRSSGGSGGSGGKKSKTEIDWIERKITILNNKIDAFATKANDTWSSWTSRTKALNSEMETTKKLLTSVYGISSKTQKKLNSQRDSAKNKLDKYVKKNSKVLTSSTIKKIKSGKLDTSKLSKKDKKVVEEYKKLQKDYNKKASKAKKASEKNPAADYYFAKANKVAKKYKLSPAIIKKIKNGTISISDYNESMANAIQKYQDYYDKGKDAQKSKKEAKQKLNELAEEQVPYIQTRYENKLSNVDYTSNKAQAKLDYAETTGHYATKKYYKQLIESANESINLNNQEADELIAKRDALVKDGALKKGSEAWYDMSQKIWKCKNNVLELTNSVAEYNNSLRDLEWDAFDRQEEYIERIIDEANFLIDIMDSKEKFDENGNITSYGKSAEGLHAINANTYQQLANDKADEIERLDAEYANDKYNKDYLERREELLEAQREAIKGYQSERSAIVNLVSDGYNAMSEALDKLIDKRKEALSSEKNLYDYQKSITEKTKSLAKLRKQLDAIHGDNSEETKAQIQKIKVSIEDAQSDLQDAEYNQWMSDQEELMDKVSDDFKDWIDNRLKNTDDIVKDVIKQTNLSTSEIKSTLETVTNENGAKLTTEMSNIFDTANGISATVSDMWNGSDSVKTKLGDVIEGIKSVVEAINKNVVDESVFNTSGSSGSDNKNSSTSNSGSTSSNKTSTTTTTTTTNKTTSSTSSSSSSKTETNAKWAAKYLKKKKFTGDKSKLNKNGSIVDRLKYFDFDSSESARSKFYKGLYKATYTGSAAQNTKLIAEMKKHGFRNGGEIGNLIRLTGEDGFILARQGEGVLSQENMDKIREAVNMSNITLSMMSNFSKIPQVKSSNMNNINQSVNIGDIQVVANNPQEFAQQLRDTVSSDTKTQKMFSAFIGNQMLGKNSLDFKKYR